MSTISGKTGFLVVLSSPSGGGKSTVSRQCLARLANISYSVSYTTRSPRSGEREGVDYYFVSRNEFNRLIAADILLEWEEVHGNLYGTSKLEVEKALSAGQEVLLDIDVKGGLRVRQEFSGQAVLVFLLPPNRQILIQRLRQRATDSDQDIAIRLANIDQELIWGQRYEYLIINDVVEQAVDALCNIILAERCRMSRQQIFLQKF